MVRVWSLIFHGCRRIVAFTLLLRSICRKLFLARIRGRVRRRLRSGGLRVTGRLLLSRRCSTLLRWRLLLLVFLLRGGRPRGMRFTRVVWMVRLLLLIRLSFRWCRGLSRVVPKLVFLFGRRKVVPTLSIRSGRTGKSWLCFPFPRFLSCWKTSLSVILFGWG